MSETVELEIERLGARGDGIGRHRGRPVYVPLTVPGDRVRVALEAPRGDGVAARLVEILAPSGARAAPACRHFGLCGGCAFQHVAPDAYAETKRGFLVDALRRAGLGEVSVAPLRRLPPGTRRRARFAVRRGRLGFQARASHDVVPLDECAVLAAPIVALLPALRRLRGNSGFSVTLTDTGLDVVAYRDAVPDLAALERLAAFAESADLARLSWQSAGEGEPVPVAQLRAPRVVMAGIAVDLPPDAFLQATPEAERELTALILAGAGEARNVADLFSGIGTFSFALAQRARVHAVEAAPAALGALRRAAQRNGLDQVTVEERDLEARPLASDALGRYEAVVFDPPRAGARAQAEALAASTVPRVVAVSCNPATFARDAATLVAGGYRIESVVPVDQFVWSPHLELVAAFAR